MHTKMKNKQTMNLKQRIEPDLVGFNKNLI